MYICGISNDTLDVIYARKTRIKNDEFQLKPSYFSLSSIIRGIITLGLLLSSVFKTNRQIKFTIYPKQDNQMNYL
jgi:hypothetical protein